jgi:replication factor C subunit 2/4
VTFLECVCRVEKYRPQKLQDVVGNDDAVQRLRAIGKDGNMPHMILTGSPGIGKTTCVMALAREMLGDSVKDGVLELNASDERGIDVVRGKIKMFAQHKVTLPPGRHKIVILDEADSMTSAAQQAMRRTMELYSSTTRFALACNNSSEIIEPIQSRCAILRFTKLSDKEILERLQVTSNRTGKRVRASCGHPLSPFSTPVQTPTQTSTHHTYKHTHAQVCGSSDANEPIFFSLL